MHTSSSSSPSSTEGTSGLPQHLIHNARLDLAISDFEDMSVLSSSSEQSDRRFHYTRPLSWMGVFAVAAALSPTNPIIECHALSVSTPSSASTGVRSLVDQARMLREMKVNGGTAFAPVVGEQSSRRPLLVSPLIPLLDNDAWVGALFDDDQNGAMSSTLLSNHLKNRKSKKSSSPADVMDQKQRAEEFDRFMEEDATVATMVKDTLKPGSLVDDVKQAKGADVDMELILQMEAMKRRQAAAASAYLIGDEKTSDKSNTVNSRLPQDVSPTAKSSRMSTHSAAISTKRRPKSSSSTKPALLTREQEYALARAIQRGSHLHKIKGEYESTRKQQIAKREWASMAEMSPNELRRIVSEYRNAKQELVSSNMGLVYAVVRDYRRRRGVNRLSRGVTEEELVQEGSLGLIRAAELFDPERGLRFSTYATIWIKGVLSNASLDELISLPQREKSNWNKIQSAFKDVDTACGDIDIDVSIETNEQTDVKDSLTRNKPSTINITEQLGMKQGDVDKTLHRMACARNVLSLDYQYSSTTRSGYAEGSTYDVLSRLDMKVAGDADLAERTQLQADVVAALVRNLNEKELQMMRLRYGLHDGQERNLRECARIMGLNRETGRLLHKVCLRKLRDAKDAESLQEYLMAFA